MSNPERATVQITERGREILGKNPSKIDNTILQQFEDFRSFVAGTRSIAGAPLDPGAAPEAPAAPSSTPEELIASASSTLDASLRDALLARVLEASPGFFEKTIIDLLLKMGYGGSRGDAGEKLGGTSDGGVDGVINEDRLGLDRIYLRAKRYKPGNTVGNEAVQAFIGALVGRGAQKGVLITISTFSRSALDAANRAGALRLVLIDGNELTKLMTRFNIGVRVAETVEIKKIDIDYFEEAETE